MEICHGISKHLKCGESVCISYKTYTAKEKIYIYIYIYFHDAREHVIF